MTRIGRRLIEDFLLPALNEGKYGDLLRWVDQEKGHFSIRWSHKNAAKWSLADTAVFQDWDRLKGRYKPDQKGYYMQAKQRFRAALYKLNTVEKLPCQDKHIKYYKLRLDADKKGDILSRKMHRMIHREENQKSIPTPVICKNTYGRGTELVGRDYFEDSSRSSTSSASPVSVKSEDCDQDPVQEKVDFNPDEYAEYQQALRRQRKQSSPTHFRHFAVKTENGTPQASVLRDSPQMNMVRKAHVPIQLVPVYNKTSSRQTMENSPKLTVEDSKNQPATQTSAKNVTAENSQPRVESPSILLVPTYNSTTVDKMEYEAVSFLTQWKINAERSRHSAEGVLNLSVKCENDILCR